MGQSSKHPAGRQQIGQVGFTLLIRHATSRIFKDLPGSGLKSDSERSRFLAWLRRRRPRRAVLLATCRRREGGGLFAGSLQDELSWLAQAAAAGCLWCDLEVESLRKLPRNSIRQYSLPRRILLSIHDFQRIPPLQPSLETRWRGEVDAIKVAGAARTIADSARLLRFAAM